MLSCKSTNMLPLSRLTMAILLALPLFGFASASHAEDFEFNTDILDVKDKANIDLSRFSQAGYVMPGNYVLTVRLDDNEIPDQSIDWVVPESDPKGSMPCLTPELVKKIGFKDEALKKITWFNQDKCMDLSSLPGVTAQPDMGSSALVCH